MPDATITSTASTFGTITGTFLADQSTITGTITGIVAGTLSGSVGVPGPVGPAGPQGPQGEPGPPGPGSTWGTITGVLSAQLDLQGQLDLKAPIASPVFTGDARAVTPAFGDDDTSISTTAFVQAALAGGTAVAKNLEVYVRNQSGSTVPAGSIVYISGATGNRPLITLAQANNDANSAQTIGFVKASIANNGFGYVMVRGELENIDTSALTEGVQLYLSPTTAGAWTTTKPSAPQHLVYVGIVIRSHPTQGVILVAVQNGYELDELHDVAIASKANNDLLTYESSTNLWKNKSFSTLGLATQSWVTAGFYPLASNPAGYLTSSALTPYLLKAGGIITGDIQSNNGSGYRSYDGLYKQTNVSASLIQLLDADVGGTTLSIESSGITFPSGKQTVHYPGTSILSGYATESWVTAGFYPLSGNPSGFITSSALTGYATQAWVDAQGYLQAGALTGYALESWVTSQGYLTDAPSDGNQYARKNGAWDIVSAGSSYITSVTAPLAVTGSDLSIDLTGYATESWVSGQGYLSAGALASLTSDVAFASGSGAGRLFIDGVYDPTSSGFTSARLNFGSSTPSQPSNGDFWTDGTTFKYFLGASYHDIASQSWVTGQGYITSSALIPYAPLASPSLSGTPTATTATADNNSTRIATTAFVVGQASSTTPADTGTAAVGTSLKYARADHVHANPLPTGGTANQVLTKVNGTDYNVTWTTPSSGGGGTTLDVYTTGGSFTWTKPANAKVVELIIVGGGGGGGSGMRSATSGTRFGGGGGGAGTILRVTVNAANLNATETVTVGRGGNVASGGAAVTTDNTVGNNGTTGEFSQFKNFRASGGNFGLGGTSALGSGGAAVVANLFGLVPSGACGAGGAGASGTGGGAASLLYYQFCMPSGGGGGGGATGGSVVNIAGGAGAGKSAIAGQQAGLQTTIAGGAGGTAVGVAPTAGTAGSLGNGGGTGGGGGAYRTAVAGMAGAVGGAIGGGGGGGSASDNGFNSGAGGQGGTGAVFVITYS